MANKKICPKCNTHKYVCMFLQNHYGNITIIYKCAHCGTKLAHDKAEVTG